MRSIFQLLIRSGGFLAFAMLEVLCFYLIVRYNEPRAEIYNYSAGRIGGKIQKRWQNYTDYIGLQERVDSLAAENARLENLWRNSRLIQIPYRDTAVLTIADSILLGDSMILRKHVRPVYDFIPAEAISNSVNLNNNWIMLNRGRRDGVTPNCGVITSKGLVGVVRLVDEDICMAMSLLHRQVKISAMLKREGAFGSLVWEDHNPEVMTLKFIPKHIEVLQGDTVVTSGFSQMFPRDAMIGIVLDATPKIDPENPYFYAIKVKLRHDMSRTKDVMIVKNLFAPQIDSLQHRVKDE